MMSVLSSDWFTGRTGEVSVGEAESSVGVLMEEDLLSYMRCEIVDVNERFVLIV